MWRDIERRANFGFFAKVPAPYPLKEFDLANQLALRNGRGVGSRLCNSYI